MKSIFIFSILFLARSLLALDSGEKVFTDIYSLGVWGEIGSSGGGASIEYARDYVAFLQNFLKENNICSVVDVGCGDWEFSKYVDWEGVHYKGLDVVKNIIDRNQESYGEPFIEFFHVDCIESELPKADLLLCKDVLQHLSNADIMRFLQQMDKFKYCLITNDINPSTFTNENHDIIRGSYRQLDLTKPPFNLKGLKVLTYRADFAIKQVLLIEKK